MLSTAARAQQAAPGDAERAQALKKRADEAMDGLRYADALAAYAQAYALTKNPALLYNQARAHQALGDYASAYDLLERFQAQAPDDLKARVPELAQLIDDVRARVAHLNLRCNVDGAEVVVRDRVIGTTPLPADVRLTSGHATLKVNAEGYRPFTREVDLPGGGSITVDAPLVRKDDSGVLVVRTNVGAADVWVDGARAGQAPLELATLAGNHAIRAERPGYDPASTTALLAPGERKDVTLSLFSPKPLTARWWFWTGIGVVVVGAAVTIVALTTERGPDSGTVSPGRVSAPLLHW